MSLPSPSPAQPRATTPCDGLDARQRALVARGDWRALVRLGERSLAANDDGDRQRWRAIADALEAHVLPALGDEDDERLALMFELGRIARDELDDQARLARLLDAVQRAASQHPRAERLARRACSRERRWLLARGRVDDAVAHARQQIITTPGGLSAMAAVARQATLDFLVAGPGGEAAWALALSVVWLEQPAGLAGLRPPDRTALLLATLSACADAAALGNDTAWRELRSYVAVTTTWLEQHLGGALAETLQRRHRRLARDGGLDRLLHRLVRAFRRDPLSLRLARHSPRGGARPCAAPLFHLAVDGGDFGIWTDLGGPMLWVEPPR